MHSRVCACQACYTLGFAPLSSWNAWSKTWCDKCITYTSVSTCIASEFDTSIIIRKNKTRCNRRRHTSLPVRPLDKLDETYASSPGLPPRTFAWTVSSELLGFWFYFFLIFSFLDHALDQAGHLISLWAYVNLPIVSYFWHSRSIIWKHDVIHKTGST